MEVKRILKEKRGNALPLACALVLALMIIFSAASEYMRLQLIAKGVRDALQTSIISVASQNYDEIYNGLREGYSGDYTLSSSDLWESKIDTGDVYGYLDKLLGLEKQGDYHIKYTSKEEEYKLSNLKISFVNAPLAPSDPENSKKFKAQAIIDLEVPLSFGWDKLPPLQITLKVDAGYTEKF
ncbi:hypothetical protein IAI10_05220 [Clostridium sp. 19966]|uniref:hypothetical protein n=1 Tax=Clostridium sp. 19966 TaxID=2768166 RepID=UPI0028E01265|nr:hypothetical protein [Clostridium sp. 19966]MDT8716046.1 hypothetical protein [Clostridium sp. 19966]